jgi:hypothetical protein
MYSIQSQHLDLASGFHVIVLENERRKRHVLQIAVGAESCPACGAAYAKDNLGRIDPKAAASLAIAELNAAESGMLAYAEKHGLTVR